MAKYDKDGNVIWAKNVSNVAIGNASAYRQRGSGMCIDNRGCIYITGVLEHLLYHSVVAHFDNIQLVSDSIDINGFVAKYDTSGHAIWAKKIGGSVFPLDIATNSFGDVVITGTFESSVNFDSIKIIPRYNTAYDDGFLAKYDKNGNAVWGKEIAGDFETFGVSVVTDRSNNIIVAGFVQNDSTVFDHIAITSNGLLNNSFIAKYDTGGNAIWAKKMDVSDASANQANYLAIDGNDVTYVIGDFENTCNFDEKRITSNGKNDVYIAKYDGSGTLQWLTSMGGKNEDGGFGINADNAGDVYVTGTFEDSCGFGNSTFYSGQTYGNNAMFVAKLTPPPAGIKEIKGTTNSMNVYPDPATSNTTIEMGEGNFATIDIADALGRKMYKKDVTDLKKVVIDVSLLTNGIYFVTARGADGSMSKKLLIQH